MSAVSTASQPITFILFRHGETERNVTGKIQGRDEKPDTQLTAKGLADAEKMGKLFAAKFPTIQKIYASPAQRCVDTANRVAKCFAKCEVIQNAALIGMNHGLNDGMGFAERNQKCNAAYHTYASTHPQEIKDPLYKWKYNPLSGAETVHQVWERAVKALVEIAESCKKDGCSIAAVATTTIPAVSLKTMSQFVHNQGVATPVPLFYELSEKWPNCGAMKFEYHPSETTLDKQIKFIEMVKL